MVLVLTIKYEKSEKDYAFFFMCNKKTSEPLMEFGCVRYGGDGGNRNRVRKPILTTFYECSLSIEFPDLICRKTGSLNR